MYIQTFLLHTLETTPILVEPESGRHLFLCCGKIPDCMTSTAIGNNLENCSTNYFDQWIHIECITVKGAIRVCFVLLFCSNSWNIVGYLHLGSAKPYFENVKIGFLIRRRNQGTMQLMSAHTQKLQLFYWVEMWPVVGFTYAFECSSILFCIHFSKSVKYYKDTHFGKTLSCCCCS